VRARLDAAILHNTPSLVPHNWKGWDVDEGPVRPTATAEGEGAAAAAAEAMMQPAMLVSLTAPKLCARHFKV
jgi:hypothetical protein